MMNWRTRLNIYTIPSTFLNIRVAVLLLLFTLVGGTACFIYIEGYTLGEAFYMAVITVSTVGYTELRPLSPEGRLFNSFYILLNIGIFAYLLAVFGYYIIQGEIFKQMHNNLIRSQIEKLSGHIIICGYGKYGREIVSHFMLHDVPFVVIEQDEQEVELIRQDESKILYIQKDATNDEVLLEAGIKRARALLTTLPDDSENLFTVFTARQLNPKLEIISRSLNSKSERKLRLAGASHVIRPEQIGGFYMATLVSKPGAVEFFSYITNEARSDIGFEELHYEDMPENIRDKPIYELRIRKLTGANIIGYKSPEGKYIVNPEPEVALLPDSSFIVLGDRQQLKMVRDLCFKQNPEK